MQVGILFGDFKLQSGLACRVLRQRCQNINAVYRRLTPRFGSRQLGACFI